VPPRLCGLLSAQNKSAPGVERMRLWVNGGRQIPPLSDQGAAGFGASSRRTRSGRDIPFGETGGTDVLKMFAPNVGSDHYCPVH
jgi:hypothetical protein